MSSQPQRPLAPEALLQHRQWVRELARRLVADPAAADDLEQQTWLAALRSPPRHDAAPRAWLATVLRSWLWKARRAEQRRGRREQLAAGGDPAPSPSTAEIVAQAEAHRAVVDAVFRLDEPLRTTVLLRFFEDLPAAEVAARTGVPLETVRSRLKRAVELLREALDERAGGRSAWLAALAPLVHPAAGVTTAMALGALVMNTTQKLIVAAVLLVGGATAFLVSMQDPPAPVPASGAGDAIGRTADPALVAGKAAPESADRSVAARAGVPVTVLVRTWNDEPIDGAVVDACVPQASGAEANEYDRREVIASSATTDAAGAVQFTGLAAANWHFVAGKPGFCRAGVPDVALRDGVRTEPVVIRLGSGHALAGRVLAADGSAVAGAIVCVFPTSSALVRPRTTTDAQGRFHFDALRAGPTTVAAALPGGTVSPRETVHVPDVNEIDLVLRTGGVLVGRVTDQAGQPVPGARVRAQTSQLAQSLVYRAASAEAVTNAEGRYRIDTLGEGSICSVTAEKEGFVQVADNTAEDFDMLIPFRDGGTWTKDLVMGRGGRLVVTVRGPDGPVAGAVVTAHQRLIVSPRPTATTDARGVATFRSLAPLRTIVGARAEGLSQPGFPTNWWQAVDDPTAPSEFSVEVREGAEATLEVALARAGTITGRVLLGDDAPLEGATVNQANAKDASSAVVTGADGSFRMPGVRAGSVPLAVARTGFVTVGKTVAEVPAAGDCTGLVLRMAPAPRVDGTVRSASGRLGEAFVQVSMVPDREQEWQERFRWMNAPSLPIASGGTYDVPLPSAEGRFAVRATALGHPSVTSPPVSIEADNGSYEVDLEIAAGHDVAGRVVAFGSSEGVSGARVRAEWLAPGIDPALSFVRGPELPPVRAVSDRTGAFVLRGMRPGRWQIHAIAEGFLAETGTTTAPQAAELRIALPAALSIEGVVQYPDGRPVAHVQLMPEPQPGNRSMSISMEPWTSSGPDGRFKMPRVPPGQYRIVVTPPRTGTANLRTTKTGIVAAGTRDLRIVVEPGAAITGRVVDDQGRGIGRVGVGAHIGDKYHAGVDTLLDGTFTLVGLEDGVSYTVTVDPSGRSGANAYAKLQQPHVAAGTSGLEFVLRPGLAVAGVVVDAAGGQLQGIEIAAMPVGTKDTYGPTGRTDQEGKFEIRGLLPGHYRLAIPQWFANELLLSGGNDVAAGTTDLRLTATKGARIRGVVVDENGSPLAGVDVEADAAQAGVFGGNGARSGADGTFDVTGLVPDAAYEVSARKRGLVPARSTATAGGPGSDALRLVLTRGLEVQGRLLDGAGKALAGINLRFAHTGSDLRVSARTGDDGSFTVTGMVEGSYVVEASMGTVERLETVPCGKVDAGQRGVELRLLR